MRKIIASIIASLPFIIFPASAGSFLLEEYNVVTIGNFDSNQHVEGRTFVGGNLVNTSAHDFYGNNLASYKGPTLQVAGKVVNGGDIHVAGDMTVGTSNTVTQNANQYKIDGRTIKNVNSVATDNNLSATTIDYKNQLEQASNSFKNLKSNSDQVIDKVNNKVTLKVNQTLAANEYAVFNLDNSNGIFSNTPNQQIEMMANNISSLAGVIINVAGLTLEVGGASQMSGNVFTSLAGRANIVWNFFEAENIKLNDVGFMGTLLAPFATVTTRGLIQGSVGVFSLLTTAEVHLPNTEVKTPDPVDVPEPSGIILFLFALLLLIANRNVVKKIH